MGGLTESYNCLDDDFYLIKTDPYGNVITEKTYGRCGEGEDFMDMIITSDDKILMYGRANFSVLGRSDIYLVKTNLNGDTIWTKVYGTSISDGGQQIFETQDKNYLQVAWWNADYSAIPKIPGKLALIKTDTAGNIIWQKIHNCPIVAGDAKELPNGDILICGSSDTMNNYLSVVALFDKNGNMKWRKFPIGYWAPVPGSHNGQLHYAAQVIQISENKFLLSGFQDTLMYNYQCGGNCIHVGYTIEFDSLGNFGIKKNTPGVYSDIVKRNDGGYIVVGGDFNYSYSGRNSSFGIESAFNLNFDNYDYGFLKSAEAPDGYVFAGGWNDGNSSNDYALAKVNRKGSNSIVKNENYFKVYPNPFNGDITVSFDLLESKKVSFILKGIDGKLISNLFDEQLSASTSYNYTFHLSDAISKGMYILEMYYEDKKVIKKIVKY